MSYRGLTTVSIKQLKIITLLVFLTGSRDQVAGGMITEKPIHAITPTSSQDDTLLNLKGNKMTKIIVKNFQHQIKFLENIAGEGMEDDR